MTMDAKPASVQEAIRLDGRYPAEAFEFLFRGLERAARTVHGERNDREPRHVTGEDLCNGLRDEAVHLWGPLAPTVLARWGVHRTRDFGEMVMLLVSLDVLSQQDSDSIEDFDDVYDFSTAFARFPIDLGA